MTKPRVAVTIGRSNYGRMFSERAWEQLNDIAIIVHHDDDEPASHDDLLSLLPGVRACITSWGVAQFDGDVIATWSYNRFSKRCDFVAIHMPTKAAMDAEAAQVAAGAVGDL